MTAGNLSMMEVTEAERQLIEIPRELGGSDAYRIEIEFRHGAWEFAMSDRTNTTRGTGVSFARAWDEAWPTEGAG